MDDGSGEHIADGEIVGEVSLRAPDESRFLLRATLPVPPGYAREVRSPVPLAVVDHQQRTVATQVNIVARYPDQGDGASVVEVIAEVERPPRTIPGDELTFQVAHHPHPSGRMLLTKTLRKMLADPSSLQLDTTDVFGNVYQTNLFAQVLEQDPNARLLRRGQLLHEYAVHEVLSPKEPKSGPEATLPRMMGVHAYVTTYARRNFLTLDLHVHNGMDGLDKADPKDDALREIYFRELNLRLPKGWRMASCFPSPSLGKSYEKNESNVYPLVKPLANGKMHVLPQQARFVRRLVIFRSDAEDEALATLGQENLAFCRPGRTPTGDDLWSWWNQDTARFFPQAHRLPELDFVGFDNLRGQLAGEYASRRAQVETGSTGNYPLKSSALGWSQPWGVQYGGMTGIDEINLTDGMDTAYAASREGYLLAMLTSRCYLDRQPTALYSRNGAPTKYEDLLVKEGFGAPYVNVSFHLTPSSSSDPFGFNNAPTFQTKAVAEQGKLPPYQSALDGWMPIDAQHYIRFTRTLKTLAWLGNDSLAKEQIRQAAEVFRLGFHKYPNSEYGYVQGSGLLTRMNYIAQFPGQGVDYQRGEGWGIDAAVAAYALGASKLRERYYPWFQTIAKLVEDGQSTCTGNIMATPVGKLMDGVAYARIVGHSSYADNSLQGMRKSVFEGRDDGWASRIGDVILGNAYAQISEGFWNDNIGQPWYYVGVGLVGKKGDFCHDIPSWAKSEYTTYMGYYSTFAYAFEYSGDDEFLFRAAQMLGGGDLLARLEDKGTDNLTSHSALLATVQSPPTE